MCTFLNGTLAAYTGDPIPEPEEIMQNMDEPDNVPLAASSEGHEPFEFQGHPAFLRYGTRHLCNTHNCGRTPEYKDHRQNRPMIW